MSRDPLAPLMALPGVEEAVRRARDAVVALHNHPVNRAGWAASAAEAALRGAQASAALDGSSLVLAGADRRDGVVTDPVLAGAVRAAEATGRLLGSWRTAPLQALARLHVLAAADLPDITGDLDSEPGRPVRGAERLTLLAELVTGGSAAPAPVLVAVVHGELLAVEPFPSANGVVARAAARLAAIGSGLDPRGLAVPEVGHLRAGAAYREAAQGFAAGTPDGLSAWIRHCCDQWVAGAREGRSIAEARSRTK
jgi:hypothetical protein